MPSITDRVIRNAYRELALAHGDAGRAEILDHLAWEVGAAAAGLVRPMRWVAAAMVATGVSMNASEAQARMARLVASQASVLDGAVEMMSRGAAGELAVDLVPSPAAEAVRRLDAGIADICLPVHARLESCPLEELREAARTMLLLALEQGGAGSIDDVVLSLLISGGEWS